MFRRMRAILAGRSGANVLSNPSTARAEFCFISNYADRHGEAQRCRFAGLACRCAAPHRRPCGCASLRTPAVALAITPRSEPLQHGPFADPRRSGMIALDQQGETTMVDLEVSGEGVALDALDAFLSSDQSPPDSMMLSDLDGFLTAIAIGPELVMPSEWLPVIWGDDEPVFTDEARCRLSSAAS